MAIITMYLNESLMRAYDGAFCDVHLSFAGKPNLQALNSKR